MTDELDIRRRRLALGLSQARLARLLGVDVTTVAKWDRGELLPRQPGVLDLALRWLEEQQQPKMS